MSFSVLRRVAAFFIFMLCLPLAASPRGTITILSSTAGAMVRINGEDVGRVPIDDAIRRAPGRYRIKISKIGYLDYLEEIDLTAGGEVDVIADLVASGAVLSLRAGAPGLVARIDGEAAGSLPLERELAKGKHVVEVLQGDDGAGEKKIVFSRSLVALPGMTFNYTVKGRSADAKDLGRIAVISSTRGATVMVEGITVGTVPLAESVEMPAGTWEVRVERRGFLSYTETVTLKAGDEVDVMAELVATSAVLTVAGHFGSTVTVDGVKRGIVPFDGELTPGAHRVVVETPGAGKLVKETTLAAGQELRLTYHPAILAEREDPSSGGASLRRGAWYKKWWVWTGAGVVVAGAVATGVALSMDSQGAPDADHTIALGAR
jgi:PEGA domain